MNAANVSELATVPADALSSAARSRLLSRPREPLFIADWERLLMIHFEIDADELQPDIPFQLDLRDGRAFVSLVAFAMHGMKPCFGGKLSEWLLRPIASHDFLNLRTYVRHGNETGIYFLTEWLSNRLAVKLGPKTFGLPYRHGQIVYQHERKENLLRGRIIEPKTHAALEYEGKLPQPAEFVPSEVGSLTEWMMERYTAFTCHKNTRRFFRIWHRPWPQCEVDVTITDDSLIRKNFRWFENAKFIGANFSPGAKDVWMGWPHRI